MTRMSVACLLAVSVSGPAAAQEMRFYYPAPQPSEIRVTKDVAYGSLKMNVYRPAAAPHSPLPALILFHAGAGDERNSPFIRAWAEIVASQQIVAIQPDLQFETVEHDFDAALDYLVANAAALGVDPDRIAVYAGSGNVSSALPLVMNPRRTSIKAAVMYYGVAPVTEFRRDLPLLLVRAGLDRPPVNEELTALVSQAATQNAPVTLINYPGGHHAFEILDDSPATRALIDRTIAFVKEATRADYLLSLQRGVPLATAAAQVAAGQFRAAAAAYAELVKAAPDDPRLGLSYGEALLGAARFAEACDQFGTLKGKGLGPRDLGIPAARACMQKGDADAAIAWLQTIPARFRPRDVLDDPIFAPLRNRADFRALF